MADPASNAPAAPSADSPTPAPAAKPLAPIPNRPAAERTRDEAGRFKAGEEGLPELLRSTESAEDEYDRASTTLDGGEPNTYVPKVTTKVRGKDILAPPEGTETPLPDEASLVEKPEGAEEEEEPAAPTPLEFAGKKFRDLKHAEQAHKSLQGMYNSEVKRSADRDYAARANFSSAMAWKAKAEALEAQGSTPTDPSAGAASGTQTGAQALQAGAAKIANATGATKESVLEAIDWDMYEQIRQKGGDTTASLWAMEQMISTMQTRFDSRLDALTRPAEEAKALEAEGVSIGQTMKDMEQWTYEGTSDPIFPEFADEEATIEIGKVIVAMHHKGLPLNFFKTPEGVNQAVLTWRDWRRRNGRPWSRASASTPTAPQDPVAAATASVARANAGAVNAGRTAPVRPAAPSAALGAEIVKGITEANKPTEFGWAR